MVKQTVMVVMLTLLVGCTGGAAEGLSTTVVAPSTTTPPATANTIPGTTPVSIPVVEHRIGVRTVGEEGEFFDRSTGERFVPRGVNLIRLTLGSHSTLDPGRYDPERIDSTFAAIAGAGYNVIRVFLNSRPGGMPGTSESLSPEYLDKAVDLLTRARMHGLQVLFTQDWLPESASWTFASDPLIDNVNATYLSKGGLETNRRFFREWVQGLIARNAPLDALFAYELRNELYFTERFPPFNLSSGVVETANGLSYDLAVPDLHRTLLEDNLIFWADTMRSEILALDPTAIVTVGFFQPKGPNTSRVGDDRLIETRQVILNSTLDFVDLHGYPGGELNLAQIVENYGLPPVTPKPILLGEFGAEHGPYPTIDDAVRALVDWQIESCVHGFDGWLMWTWDTAEQPEFWSAVNNQGTIAKALSPSYRPDPCMEGDLDLAAELATGASATASAETAADVVANAVDGLPVTIWSAGGDAPQWIEIDLGSERMVEAIRLLVAQYPAGASSHRVSVRGESGDGVEVARFDQDTSDGEWLEIDFPEQMTAVRFIRIDTAASVSHVAWREISVLGK